MTNEKGVLRKIIELLAVFVLTILIGVAGYVVHRVDAVKDDVGVVKDELHRVDKYAAVTDAKLTIIEAKIDALAVEMKEFRREVRNEFE